MNSTREILDHLNTEQRAYVDLWRDRRQPQHKRVTWLCMAYALLEAKNHIETMTEAKGIREPFRNTLPSRPAFTVEVRHENVTARYDANHLAYVVHDGKYCLQFISSGTLSIIPMRRVVSVEFAPISEFTNHCGVCDQELNSWPANDPAYGKQPLSKY